MQLSTVLGAGAWLAACAPAPAPAQTGAAGEGAEGQAAPAEATQVMWYTRTSPQENNWEREVAIPGFQEKNPGITIDHLITPWEQFHPKLLALNSAGTPPDVWVPYGSTGFPGYYVVDMLLPLDDLVANSPLKMDDYPQPVVDFFTVNGMLMGMPFMTCGSYVFYHKDLFDADGVAYPTTDWSDQSWTWDAMVATAKTLTKNYGQGADAQYGLNHYLGAWQVGWDFGLDIFPREAYETGYPETIDLTSPDIQAAMQASVDIIFKDQVAPTRAELQAVQAIGDPFTTGKIAMIVTGGWGFWVYKDTEFEWGAAALPWGGSAAERWDSLYPDAYLLSKATQHPDAAWALVEYLSGLDGMKGYMEATGAPPAAQSLLGEWYTLYSEKIPLEELTQTMEGSMQYGRIPPSHAFVDTNRITTELDQNLDPMYLGDAPPAEVLPVAEEAVQVVLDENKGKSLETS